MHTHFALAVLGLSAFLPVGMPKGTPPSDIRDTSSTQYIYEPVEGIRATISLTKSGSSVAFQWEHSADGWKTILAKKLQVLSLGFAAAESDFRGSKLYIAGEAEDGATVIEEWALGAPSLEMVPSGQPLEGYTRIKPPELVARKQLYRETAVGRNGVLTLHLDACKAVPKFLIVYFEDSHDVYQLQLESRKCELVFSSSAPSTALVEPKLRYPYDNFWKGRHKTHGGVYVFGVWGSSAQCLVLLDTDCDGTLDQSIVIADDETWVSLGFAVELEQWTAPQ